MPVGSAFSSRYVRRILPMLVGSYRLEVTDLQLKIRGICFEVDAVVRVLTLKVPRLLEELVFLHFHLGSRFAPRLCFIMEELGMRSKDNTVSRLVSLQTVIDVVASK